MSNAAGTTRDGFDFWEAMRNHYFHKSVVAEVDAKGGNACVDWEPDIQSVFDPPCSSSGVKVVQRAPEDTPEQFAQRITRAAQLLLVSADSNDHLYVHLFDYELLPYHMALIAATLNNDIGKLRAQVHFYMCL